MRKSALAALTAAAVLAAPAVAQAHVTLNPREVTAGSFTVMNVRVPNERDDSGTTKVDVRFPDGFFSALYEGTKWTAAFKGAFSSRADDSTFLSYSDINGDNTLLLPNRNLDFGYAKLDAYGTYAATNHISAFAELGNLLSQQRIGPIGYPGLPFTFRTGLKIRVGGD